MPALWLFVIPVIGLLFFQYAQAKFDDDVRKDLIQQINADPQLTPAQKAESVQVVREVPFSEMLLDPTFALDVDPGLRRDYATFRWMIRISIACLVSGAGVFAFAGLCVLLSDRSQQAQYLSLYAGWHVLRLVSVIQIVGQGAVIVALSFWVTALVGNVYYPAIPGSLEFAGKRAILRIVFVNEDLLVG
ncbi:MAG: hypothetical protein O2820_16505 [Planctomycetota bacterium]|nr:hypothetical protein [Planctomycetota bacterium]